MVTHNTNLRVRYQETDKMGVVYNANYFVWFEVGRTEYYRSLGMSYNQMEQRGIMLPVIEANCKYKRPATYDDYITVETTIAKLTPVRIRFSYHIKREEELLVTGFTEHAFVDSNGRPINVSKAFPDIWGVLTKNRG